ncbi:MAG: hypothetical protein GY791_17335 [Alphaproteobacteria bacterium]|nr:hypothetical protein [Alphaproteobacteria bacterium]
MTVSRLAAATAAIMLLGLTAEAADEPSPAARTFFDSCMGSAGSTEEFCRCGVGHYERKLSAQEFSLVAAISAQVAAGQKAAFDAEADRLGLTAAEKDAALAHIGDAAKGAALACDPLIKK